MLLPWLWCRALGVLTDSAQVNEARQVVWGSRDAWCVPQQLDDLAATLWGAQGTVSATLLGDLASYAAWPDVTGKYLMVPSPTGRVSPSSAQTVDTLSGIVTGWTCPCCRVTGFFAISTAVQLHACVCRSSLTATSCCCTGLACCRHSLHAAAQQAACHVPDAGQDTAASLQANRSAWLVIPPSLVSEAGNDCDLVGTSFAAFRNQVVSECVRSRWLPPPVLHSHHIEHNAVKVLQLLQLLCAASMQHM